MVNRVVWLLIVAAGCGSDAARPSTTDCAVFLDHAAALERAGNAASSPMADRLEGEGRATFLKRCPSLLTRHQLDCALAASDLAGLDRCVDRGKLGEQVDAPPSNPLAPTSTSSADPVAVTRALVQTYVSVGYVDWARDHPGKACPDSIADLANELARSDSKDAWGNDLAMVCGGDLPAAAANDGVAVMSSGPDGKRGTSDDIKSWDRGGAPTPLDELETIKTRACACKNAACANQVQEEFEAWAKRHSDVKGTQSEADKASKIAGDISECMVKAMGGDDDLGGTNK